MTNNYVEQATQTLKKIIELLSKKTEEVLPKVAQLSHELGNNIQKYLDKKTAEEKGKVEIDSDHDSRPRPR